MISIQQVEEQDIKALAQLEAACFPKEEAADEQTLLQRAHTFPESFLVMKKEGIIIGMINGCVSNERAICDAMFEDVCLHEPQGSYQTIFGLDVHPKYQHQGYAQQLMEALIKASRQAGRKALILTCKEHLLPFYEQFGYRNMGVSASTHGGAVWYDMVLVL